MDPVDNLKSLAVGFAFVGLSAMAAACSSATCDAVEHGDVVIVKASRDVTLRRVCLSGECLDFAAGWKVMAGESRAISFTSRPVSKSTNHKTEAAVALVYEDVTAPDLHFDEVLTGSKSGSADCGRSSMALAFAVAL